ncbi:MAG TPA: hypothetical protein IAB72_04330 [Candidatus Onthoplasma faecipullorum]|nr:hypothetical protein [Candidatus Onthoplasma faecipullorum]
MSSKIKYINEIKEDVNYPPYKCKVCGLEKIKYFHSICNVCGWEADGIQDNKPDYMGGANKMSLNQYKKFWRDNKNIILLSKNKCFTAIDLAKKYYKENFAN